MVGIELTPRITIVACNHTYNKVKISQFITHFTHNKRKIYENTVSYFGLEWKTVTFKQKIA